MKNFLKKWPFFLGISLALALFLLVWGCFTASEQRVTDDWNLNPNAEKIYDYLVLDMALRSDDVEEVKLAILSLIDRYPAEDTFVDAISTLTLKDEKKMAFEISEEAYLLYPDSDKISLLYAESLLQNGKLEESISLLRSYVKKKSYETHIVIRLAELLIKQNEYAQADEVLNLIPIDSISRDLDLFFSDEEDIPLRQTASYLYTKGRAQLGMGNKDEAEILLEQAVEKSPEFIDAWAELAYLYENDKQPEKALEIYNSLLDMNHDNSLIWIRIIYIELQMGQVEKAYSTVERAPPSFLFLMQVAQLFMKNEAWDRAEQVFLKAATSPEMKDEVFLGLFFAASEGTNKDITRAINYLDMVPSDSPVFERAILYKVHSLANINRLDDSHATIDDAIEKYPAQLTFWQSKVALYHIQKKHTKCEKLLDKALKKFPRNPELMFSKGALYDNIGRPEEAMQVMEEIIKYYPANSAALNYIGYSLAVKGEELDRAYVLITKALEGDPGNAHIIDSLAWVYYKRGDYAAAYKSILKAIEYSPIEPEIWEHYGDISRAVNKVAQAKEAYIQALKLKPDNPEEIQKKLADLQEF